ncbi:MAG: hypothetical protein K0R08_949 [Solimicrobium sp.]|jgi:hypothetical protein|nr:hypothetical protein [Solimicrobium sp.]
MRGLGDLVILSALYATQAFRLLLSLKLLLFGIIFVTITSIKIAHNSLLRLSDPLLGDPILATPSSRPRLADPV